MKTITVTISDKTTLVEVGDHTATIDNNSMMVRYVTCDGSWTEEMDADTVEMRHLALVSMRLGVSIKDKGKLKFNLKIE